MGEEPELVQKVDGYEKTVTMATWTGSGPEYLNEYKMR